MFNSMTIYQPAFDAREREMDQMVTSLRVGGMDVRSSLREARAQIGRACFARHVAGIVAGRIEPAPASNQPRKGA